MRQKVLLFGSCGMLGQSIKKFFLQKDDIKLVTAARANADYNFDFCNDKEIELCFSNVMPDVVINSAAIVSLDECEKNKFLAYQINSRFVSILENLCRAHNSYLVQISTDHYYQNAKDKKHDEKFPLTFINEYARTKFCGEQFALSSDTNLVLRTNIVGFKFHEGKKTFLEWVLENVAQDLPMTLFTDFYTSSIHTSQFAKILYDILQIRPHGIYNLASSTVLSKKEFILNLANKIFQKNPNYKEASVKGNRLNVQRADSLGLDVSKIENLLGYKMPNQDEVIESIKTEIADRRILK